MKYSLFVVAVGGCFAVLLLGFAVTESSAVTADDQPTERLVPKHKSKRLSLESKQDATGFTIIEDAASPADEGGNIVEEDVVEIDRALTGEEKLLSRCPQSDGFVFPVGAPDAKGYYDAQPFGRNYHLGEDWNGNRGGNSDLGDPIYSISNGIVFFTEDIGNGWGTVVRIVHNLGTVEQPKYVDSLYAHLDEVFVTNNQVVKKGQQIGTMGNCDGLYAAHLHFEIRSKVFMPIGGGYSADNRGYLNPKKFIKKHSVIVQSNTPKQ